MRVRGAAAVPVVTLTVLILATLYEFTFAIGVLKVGALPGQEPKGSDWVVLAAFLAMMSALVLCVIYALVAQPRGKAVAALLVGPAAAAFVLARFYTPDPYYAPALRRISDGGMVPQSWVIALLILAVAASILAGSRRQIGFAACAMVIVLCLFTAVAENAGH